MFAHTQTPTLIAYISFEIYIRTLCMACTTCQRQQPKSAKCFIQPFNILIDAPRIRHTYTVLKPCTTRIQDVFVCVCLHTGIWYEQRRRAPRFRHGATVLSARAFEYAFSPRRRRRRVARRSWSGAHTWLVAPPWMCANNGKYLITVLARPTSITLACIRVCVCVWVCVTLD